MIRRVAPLVLAVLLDVSFGEPPEGLHPVVGMGRLADRLEARLPPTGHPAAVGAGGLAWAAGLVLVMAAARVVARGPWWLRGGALWTLGSGRMLVREVAAVEEALQQGGVEAGRRRLSTLVSRPVDDLDVDEVRMAAVETLAENLSDSVVAPLGWWTVAGLPGAAAYRWVNTLDARWGHRTPAWDRPGRVAARADDVANLVPARLTAMLLAPSVVTQRPRELCREAGRTVSPNAGWPMAAVALAQDVRLAKRDTYVVHANGRPPTSADVRAACQRAVAAGAAAVVLAAAVAVRWRPRWGPA